MMRDIVNRDLVNLENCDQEPIQFPGSIQPHGFLIALDDEARIRFCSDNLENFTGVSAKAALNHPFPDAFGMETYEALMLQARKQTLEISAPLELVFRDQTFECTVHRSGAFTILEGEPKSQDLNESINLYRQTSVFLTQMAESLTLQALCQHVADSTREIIGYDRVMVYKFDENYNGQVFAESKVDGIEPFLGLYYPHTDIPSQARELYLQNLLRLIVDVNYTPVPLLTMDADARYDSLDLSHAVLRSTSPIHVQYLHNIGVGATLTISLVHKEKLWGLIACHHYSARNIPPAVRLIAKLQGQFLTSQIDARQLNEEYELSRRINRDLEQMNALPLVPKAESLRTIIDQPELLALCQANGVSVMFRDDIFTRGIVPTDQEIRELSRILYKKTKGSTFHTNRIKHDLAPENWRCENVSGLDYHALSPIEDYNIIWYRNESISEVHWAGDPSKAIEKDSKGLSPRKSFELYKEFVKCQSKPWRGPELLAAANYANTLQRHLNLILLSEESRRNRELNETLKETNAELENINWISTHDLQEPLRKIQLLATRLLTKEGESLSQDASQSLLRMNASAGRMQNLLIDILKYTRIRHTKAVEEEISLEALVQMAAHELPETSDEEVEIQTGPLPVIRGIPFLLNQLFVNLLNNAVKYNKADQVARVTISAHGPVKLPNVIDPEQWYHEIRIRDNGIGFEKQFNESIFNLFSRLHNNSGEYKGSGVGLALCKKIMQTHNGYIRAEGHPGEGAEFILHFPVTQ